MRARRLLCAAALSAIFATAAAGELPAGLFSPDHFVVCDKAREICFDRFGPSIGLTEAFLGRKRL